MIKNEKILHSDFTWQGEKNFFFTFLLHRFEQVNKKNMEKLPFTIIEFLERCHEEIPAVYGKLITKKIIEDSNFLMTPVSEFEERGDTTIGNNLYFEVKSSYLNKNGKFSIKNIRPWQSFDYFILCLVDTTEERYKPYFYCITKESLLNNPVLVFTGQNNTKISNEGNNRVALSTTFPMDDHSWLFKKENILEGTSYGDLMVFIRKQHKSSDKFFTEHHFKTVDKVPIHRSPARKIYLRMGDLVIDGRSNKEVMTNLVKYVGASKLDGIVWNTWLNKTPNKDRIEYVGEGYYFNPKFSLRDLTTTVNQINKKLNLSFNILNK